MRKRSKYKPNKSCVTLPMFALPKSVSDNINKTIRDTLLKMYTEGYGWREWVDMITRMQAGEILIKKNYTEDTVSQFAPCIETCRGIELRARNTDYASWDITKEEYEILSMGLEALEQVQTEVLRRDFLKAHDDADIIILKNYKDLENHINKTNAVNKI